MKKRNAGKISCLIMACILILTMIPAAAFSAESAQSEDIVILFTGDVHGQADENLGYAGLKAYENEMRRETRYVSVVDAGDAMSGNMLSAVSRGKYSAEAMKLSGYTAAVPGIHDFDYGADYFCSTLAPLTGIEYISCNFVRTSDNKAVFSPFKLVPYGGKMVAYVGISDPLTMEMSAGDFGTAYDFCDGNQGVELYYRVQNAIDTARAIGAEYVIAVAHLSDDAAGPYSAQSVIKNTSGLTAVIQGGTHAAFAGQSVKDAGGNTVLLTSAGSGLKNIGVLKIKTNNTLEGKLISNYNLRDVKVQDEVKTLQARYNGDLSKDFAVTTSRLEATSSSGTRTVDKKETNLGDLTADAYRAATGADLALVESRELRASLALGDISYKDILKVLPEGKPIGVAEISGADLMDALEMSARLYPNSNGGFFQISGLTYDIQETVIPSVSLDGFGNFRGISGEYRVTNVMINGAELDLFATYRVAGTEDLLSGATGYTMFRNGTVVQPGVTSDNLAVISYLTNNLKGTAGGRYAKSQGRVDSIRLVRQSELEQEVADLVKDDLKEYENRIAQLEKQLKQKTEILAIKDMEITASSKYGKSSGKRYIQVKWEASEEVEGLKYQVYKSTKKSSGYSKMKSTSSLSYKNSSGLTKGKTYYYKVRGYKSIGGKTYYSSWSNVVSRKVTS